MCVLLVTPAIESMSKLDFKTANRYFPSEEFMISMENDLPQGDDVTRLMLENLSVKVLSSSENGDKATVKAEIGNIDMGKIFGEYLLKMFEIAFSTAFSDQDEMTDDDYNQVLVDLLTLLYLISVPAPANEV